MAWGENYYDDDEFNRSNWMGNDAGWNYKSLQTVVGGARFPAATFHNYDDDHQLRDYAGRIFRRYHRDYRQANTGMSKILPWVISMSLLNMRQFAATETAARIPEDLTPPAMVSSSMRSFDNSKHLMKENMRMMNGEPMYANHQYDFQTNHQQNSWTMQQDARQKYAESSLLNIHMNKNIRLPPYGPSGVDYKNNEFAGPALELAYSWIFVDFEFDSTLSREDAIMGGNYIPENNLPLGLEVTKDRVFVTLPRWKSGVPATLTTIPRSTRNVSPKLKPYPNWQWHTLDSCERLTSVFRVQVDECNRLWVLDSGKVDVTSDIRQICPPAIFIFDLSTDRLVKRYPIPDDQIKQDSLYSNIVVDVRNGECDAAVAYLSDVWRFGLIVYDLLNDTSFRVQHHYFLPDPLASRYELHGLQFHWTDGIFGIALSPIDVNGDKTLFFHPMSSFREFSVPTSVLRSKRSSDDNVEKFVPIGKPRAKDYGHSSGSAIDRRGIMFFNMVTRDSVWCWDTRKAYIPQNLGVIGTNNVSLVFPNDLRVDHDAEQNVWVLSNRLPMYLYQSLSHRQTNFRIFRANVKEAVRNTVCDPNYLVPETEQVFDDSC